MNQHQPAGQKTFSPLKSLRPHLVSGSSQWAPSFDPVLGLIRWLPPVESTPVVISRALYDLMDFLFGGKRVKTVTRSNVLESTLSPTLKIEHYRPQGLSQRSLLFVHGGGWVLGNHRSHRRFCALMAHRLRANVFAVHYRRAPEHPMTTALEDVREAWTWLWNHPQWGMKSGIRPALCGDSAGGHLAALVSAHLKGEQTPLFQSLIYPVTSYDFQGLSMERFKKGLILTRSMMEWFWKVSLPSFPVDLGHISPMHHPHMAQSPPTLLALAGCDVLYDQGLAFAHKLKLHHVTVNTMEFPTMIHGFLNLLGNKSAFESAERILGGMDEMFSGLGEKKTALLKSRGMPITLGGDDGGASRFSLVVKGS